MSFEGPALVKVMAKNSFLHKCWTPSQTLAFLKFYQSECECKSCRKRKLNAKPLKIQYTELTAKL